MMTTSTIRPNAMALEKPAPICELLCGQDLDEAEDQAADDGRG